MERATLGGVPGAGEAWSRGRDASSSAHRGTFWFKAEHERTIAELFNARAQVEFEGMVDGEHRRLKTRVTSLDVASGVAFFDGAGP